jgi:endonuclease/exonuclease/phosphatase family metal-dependent hydrolase
MRYLRRTVLMLLVPILLVGVVVAPGLASAPDDTPARSVELRLMSFNIAHCMSDLDHTAQVIEASGADVVGLQEVDRAWGARSDFADQAKVLAEQLDMHVFFGPIYSFDPLDEGLPRQEYGLAYLSRYPIIDATNHEITRLPTTEPDPEPVMLPGFPHIRVNVNGVHVDVFNTHLDYRGDPWIREMQVDDMLAITGTEPTRSVLMGDLNAEPEDPELAPVFDVYRDAWELAGDGAGLTFPTDDPEKRIDYVLTSPDIDVVNAEVLDTDASDHLPVVADVVIERDDRAR